MEIRLNLGENSYNINIKKGIINEVGKFINYKKVAIITDENVDKHYGKVVESQFNNCKKLVLPAGESTKSIEMLEKCYDFLIDFEISRSDAIIALGGGVIGDLVGFAAATVLRGVPFIQIPTTLLAQVDSSVGGKVAVNLPKGKNLVGAFYQPKAVFIDTDVLKTLDKRQYACGMAEVIKYGAIFDDNLFSVLEEGNYDIDDIVAKCCTLKKNVVEADQFDKGQRMVLNFGHTYGHCVEKYFNYSGKNHGEAVAIGMVKFAKLGEDMGITPKGTYEKIAKVCEKYNLPTEAHIPFEDIKSIIVNDKKSESDNINIILLKEIGNGIIHKMSKQDLLKILK